jgi:subtilase family serine protease
MIDIVLSTDTNVPPGFATFSPNFSEDVLLLGARTSNTIDLAPGASKVYATGAGIPADTPTGNYQICARIDSGSKVAESNEANNVMCRAIKITHP